MAHWYGSRLEIKRRVLQGESISDTRDDPLFDLILASVSREIERFCKRESFGPYTATQYFTALHRGLLLVPDLLSVTTLKTLTDNSSGTRTYGDTWTTTDYDLEPPNAQALPLPKPYDRIAVNPGGDYWFPLDARGVQIVAKWGYYDQRVTSSTTLGAAISSTTATSITLSANPTIEPGQTILIDSEQMFVSEVQGTTATVKRGQNGTTAATHSNGAAIDVYEYPMVTEALLMQAEFAYRTSMTGSGEFSQRINATGLHPFVRKALHDAEMVRVEVG